MLRLTIGFLLYFLVSASLQGQVGIINDPDGYANVRAAPSIEAEVIYQLKSNELFFYHFEFELDGEWFAFEDSTTNWIELELPPNRFSLYTDNTPPITGYIHKSRLLPIESLKQITNDKAYLIFEIIPGTERIKDSSMTNSFYYISGKIPFGLEVGLSRSTAIASCILIIENDTINIDYSLLDDLFNITPDIGYFSTIRDTRCSVFKKEDSIFIYQKCGDGAGYYEIVWCIKGNQIVQRLVGWIY